MKGNGLGLAIVAGITRDWGGTLTVASEVGQGTAITIRLPVLTPESGCRG